MKSPVLRSVRHTFTVLLATIFVGCASNPPESLVSNTRASVNLNWCDEDIPVF